MATSDFLDIDVPLGALDSLKDPRGLLYAQLLPGAGGGTLAAAAPATTTRQAPNDADGEQLAAQAWAAALRAGITKANHRLPSLLAPIRTARRLGLVIQLITALSASGVVGLVVADGSQAAKIAAAIISLAGALLSIAVTHTTKDELGNDRVQSLQALYETIAEADGLALELEIWALRPPPRPLLDPAQVTRAKELVIGFTRHR